MTPKIEYALDECSNWKPNRTSGSQNEYKAEEYSNWKPIPSTSAKPIQFVRPEPSPKYKANTQGENSIYPECPWCSAEIEYVVRIANWLNNSEPNIAPVGNKAESKHGSVQRRAKSWNK